MKKRLWMIVLAAALSGCGEKPAAGPAPATATNSAAGGSPLTAPVDYLKAAGQSEQKAVKTADLTSLNQAVQLFNVEHGRNPTNLNELVVTKFIPRIPAAPYGTRIAYDPGSGKVEVVKQ